MERAELKYEIQIKEGTQKSRMKGRAKEGPRGQTGKRKDERREKNTFLKKS